MTRYKTHLIAVKKSSSKDETIMRDIRDAMEYLAIMVGHHHARATPNIRATKPAHRDRPLSQQSPATHIYCYDAQVIPFPLAGPKN